MLEKGPIDERLADPHLDEKIDYLFGYYRRRRANAIALKSMAAPELPGIRPGTFRPDLHVLIGSGLEALANVWTRLFRPDLDGQGPAGNRWSEFLQANSNQSGIFNKVAGPLLADQLQANEKNDEASVVRNIVHDTDDFRSGIVRFWDEDPDFLTFQNEPKIRSLNLNTRLLQRFRYGEVLYKEYRCHWSHHLAPSERLAPSDLDDDREGWGDDPSRVRYWNYGLKAAPEGPGRCRYLVAERRLLFPDAWLFAIYDDVLNALEASCRADRRSPIAEDGTGAR